jgi:hypothetical protein
MLPNYAQSELTIQHGRKDDTARPFKSTKATVNPSVGRGKLLCLPAGPSFVLCKDVGVGQIRLCLCWALVIGSIQQRLHSTAQHSTPQHTTGN